MGHVGAGLGFGPCGCGLGGIGHRSDECGFM